MIACATIVVDGKVLLVKHSCVEKPDFGDWILPAGQREMAEGLKKALRREMKEELGLEVKIIRKIAEHADPYTGDNLANFLCTLSTSEIHISSELAEARWFSLNEIRKMEKIHPGPRQFLISGLESDWCSSL